MGENMHRRYLRLDVGMNKMTEWPFSSSPSFIRRCKRKALMPYQLKSFNPTSQQKKINIGQTCQNKTRND